MNLMEGGSTTRGKVDRKVADDEEEAKWVSILVQTVEGIAIGEESQKIYDDLTGKELDPKKVEEARRGDVEFVEKNHVYEECPIEEC